MDHEKSNAVDAYGFGALPIAGGSLDSLGKIEEGAIGLVSQCNGCQDMEGGNAIFWASCPATETETAACGFSIPSHSISVNVGTTDPLNLMTVRCIKD